MIGLPTLTQSSNPKQRISVRQLIHPCTIAKFCTLTDDREFGMMPPSCLVQVFKPGKNSHSNSFSTKVKVLQFPLILPEDQMSVVLLVKALQCLYYFTHHGLVRFYPRILPNLQKLDFFNHSNLNSKRENKRERESTR